ncbi:transcriptional regulator [Gordonibacter sp. An230]|uniref:winged helix-turn-helix transcriptional regulator n=1 Tax=Gordonibacter sp. An230 TaxID=1965592 RepID=UPI000B37BE1B|nr:helix-turn-helix domain-containing protein [Gordonibacter sp. An230]OUO90919.1 transcriptional regulator [Gordonibacter sp. An230]
MAKDPSGYRCPVEAALDVVGGRHKALILWHLRGKTLRFGELRRLVSQVTPKMLAQQLRELEADGMLSRTVYAVVPPKTEYALTELGRSFAPVLEALCDWGGDYLDRVARDRRCAEEK